jgi:hypothetical protein
MGGKQGSIFYAYIIIIIITAFIFDVVIVVVHMSIGSILVLIMIVCTRSMDRAALVLSVLRVLMLGIQRGPQRRKTGNAVFEEAHHVTPFCL